MTVTEYKDAMEGNLAYKLHHNDEQPQNPLAPTPLKYTSVMLTEVQANNLRLEASAFNLDAKAAKYKVEHCPYGYVHLWGEDGLVKEAYYGGRAKRNYVPKNTIGATGFIGSAEMLEIKPKPIKFLSAKTMNTAPFQVNKGTILISRSGTIGNVTFVNETLSNLLVSEHAIRIIPKKFAGYIYAFLKTKTGKALVQANTFGAVVDQIEPEHLKNIIIPNAPEGIKQMIHEAVIVSYDLRDQSNELIDSAEALLYQELQLPPIEQLKPEYFDETVDLRNYTTRLNDLDLRLDPSFHIPETKAILELINKTSKTVKLIGDKEISKKIILAGRFKRTYVDAENGIPFFGGKQLLELNPSNVKYLSTDQHSARIDKELFLKENMIAVTCSGTIGKVNIIPKHWENWTLNQHVMRIVPSSSSLAGYIYCWLNTDYGYNLIIRHTYGSVVDEIDDRHLSKVEIPLLKNEAKQREINDMVLQANALRYQAHLKEQEAIEMMEGVIEGMVNLKKV